MKIIKDYIVIDKWKENKDGSVKMTYHLTEYGYELFKQLARTKKKKFDDAFVNKCIMQAIEEAMSC